MADAKSQDQALSRQAVARAERRAAALRENLKRRKHQARARAAGGKTADEAPPADSLTGGKC